MLLHRLSYIGQRQRLQLVGHLVQVLSLRGEGGRERG